MSLEFPPSCSGRGSGFAVFQTRVFYGFFLSHKLGRAGQMKINTNEFSCYASWDFPVHDTSKVLV